MIYQPFRLIGDSVAELKTPDYREFLHRSVLTPGLQMLMQRHRRRPDYPFPDTKFNPNTGREQPLEAYDEIYTWFLGRGGETCAGYLTVLDSISGLSTQERTAAREMLEGFVRAQNEAIMKILERNEGRIPFRVNREYIGIDRTGDRVRLSGAGCNASEIFAAKALLAGGDSKEGAAGVAVFKRFVDSAFRNGYEDDTAGYDRNHHAESPFMLAFAAFRHLLAHDTTPDGPREWAGLARRMMDYVLSTFWDAERGRFYELIDFTTRRREPPFIPGHACELVGLGLQAITALQAKGALSAGGENGVFAEAIDELLRILSVSYELGYDHEHGGILQSVDPDSGQVLNDDLSWWCLPEAMRAAAYAVSFAPDGERRARSLEILRTASNDYFTYYPNPAFYLFPFRTRSGRTGKVRDYMPVVPEADPLYHSNLSFIDMLDAIGRL